MKKIMVTKLGTTSKKNSNNFSAISCDFATFCLSCIAVKGCIDQNEENLEYKN